MKKSTRRDNPQNKLFSLAGLTVLLTSAALLSGGVEATRTSPHHYDHLQRVLKEGDDPATVDELLAWKNSKAADIARKNGFYPSLPDSFADDGSQYSKEELQRFIATKKLIEQAKAQNPDAEFTLDSPFTLLNMDEFTAVVGGGGLNPPLLPRSTNSSSSLSPSMTSSLVSAPSSVDWSTSGCVAPAKNQGGCGSCAYFAAVAAIEASKCLYGGDSSLTIYSEQQPVSCVQGGCAGGWPATIIDWIKDNGLCRAKDDPYTSGETLQNGQCGATGCTRESVNIESVGYADTTEEAYVNAIAGRPITIALNAMNPAFKQYQKGVIESCGQTDGVDHGVLAVGYTPTEWKLKNSWGDWWGENGYLRIRRGVAACRMMDFAPSYPIMKPVSYLSLAAYDQNIRSFAGQNLCLDIPRNSLANAEGLQVFTCDPAKKNQQFRLDNQNRLVVQHSGKCLDVYYAATASGSRVVQHDCNDGDNQKWLYDSQGRLHPKHAPWLCLDVPGSQATGGAAITVWTCNSGANQKWGLGYNSFNPQNMNIRSNIRANFCLDIPNNSLDNLVRVAMFTCDASKSNQQFLLDSKQRLVVKHSGMCLDVFNAGTQAGAFVGQGACHELDNQKWVYDSEGRLHPKHAPNLCLDIQGGSVADSANVILWTCNQQLNQKWTVAYN